MKQSNSYQPNVSAWLVTGITLVALLIGWIAKINIENRTQAINIRGVNALAPDGWTVTAGLSSKETVFTVRSIFSPTRSYSVSFFPTVADLTGKDVAFNNNLDRAGFHDSYRVLDQEEANIAGKQAYSVHFAYVNARDNTEVPQVIEGKDYIFIGQPNALIVTLEDKSDTFVEAEREFARFLNSITYSPGGK